MVSLTSLASCFPSFRPPPPSSDPVRPCPVRIPAIHEALSRGNRVSSVRLSAVLNPNRPWSPLAAEPSAHLGTCSRKSFLRVCLRRARWTTDRTRSWLIATQSSDHPAQRNRDGRAEEAARRACQGTASSSRASRRSARRSCS